MPYLILEIFFSLGATDLVVNQEYWLGAWKAPPHSSRNGNEADVFFFAQFGDAFFL